MELADWLRTGEGVIATGVVVALILIIRWSIFGKHPVKRANKSETTEKPEKPEIAVLIRPHASCIQALMLCIENIGTGTAYNVQFGIGDVGIFNENTFLQNGIGCFGPGQKLEQFLIRLTAGLPEELKQSIQIDVTYTDALNYAYNHRYALDFGKFESVVHIDSEK